MDMAVCNSSHTLLSSLFFFFFFFFFYYLITLLYYFPLQANADALSFNLSNFNETLQNVDITITGDAYVSNKGIQITPGNGTWKAGRATYKDPLHLWDKASGNLTDFNCHFWFVIDSQGNTSIGDGLAFFLLPSNFTSINPSGAAMGLPITSIKIPQSSPSGVLEIEATTFVAVEFDTFENSYWDPSTTSGTHEGINFNTIISNVTQVWYNNITYGKDYEAWISYDSSSKNLSVVFTGYMNNNRIESVLSCRVDLRDYLPEWVNIGFSAGTGDYIEKHTVKSWLFNSSLPIHVPVSPSTNPSPSANTSGPGKKKKALVVGLTVGSSVLVGGLALLGFVFWKKSSRAIEEDDDFAIELSMNNEFEAGTGPKKFSYGELVRATNYFAEEQKLGEGGFGGVYKGFLRELNSYVAVKRISKGSKQGIKEYASEVKIISRLRHRNLVQLIGWCHDKRELLLVYEFMENGSLDYHLFKEQSLLTWAMRYKIAQGLASALLYLHEGWEQCVVHRDIKSSNVMLDSNYNAKLGDFGLARFVDHEKGLQTTVVAGTMAYMAPECLVTSKASKESDVYSFGIVALEIACGRKPIDPNVHESQTRMVEWVWDLYGTNRLLEAADSKLCADFVQEEMECLMIVGLWCAYPDHNLRPSIRQAIHVLNFEAPLPILPTKMPVATYFAPSLNNFSSFVSSPSGSTPISNNSQVQSSMNTSSPLVSSTYGSTHVSNNSQVYNTAKFTSSSTASSPSTSRSYT